MNRLVLLLLLVAGWAFAFPCYGQFTSMGLDGQSIQEMQIIGDRLYAATNEGLYARNLQTDTSWTSLGLKGRHVNSVLVFSADSLIAGIWQENEQDSVYIYRTTDGGTTWESYQNGFGQVQKHTRTVVDLDKAAPAGDTLFGVNQWYLYRSTDRGQTWQIQDTSGYGTFAYVMANYSDKQRVYGGSVSGDGTKELVRTIDGGVHWDYTLLLLQSSIVPQTFNSVPVFNGFSFQPGQTDTALVGGRTIHRTLNGGSTWEESLWAGYGQTITSLQISERRDSLIYAGSWEWGDSPKLRLFISTDGGDNWSLLQEYTSRSTTAIHDLAVRGRKKSEVIYIGTDRGVFRYTYDLSPVDPFRPQVSILAPADSTFPYYRSQPNEWYKGVQLIVEGRDRDGMITEFGWAVDEGSYHWTSRDTILIPPSRFGSAGDHRIRVTARDDAGHRARPDTVQVTLVSPGLSDGILIVDDTDEEQIDKQWARDGRIDSLYASWVAPRTAKQWDISRQGLPTRKTLGRYEGVFWHADNHYLVASKAHNFGRYADKLSDYLNVGGKLVVSGWKVLKSLYPTYDFSYPGHKFSDKAFARRYLQIDSAATTGSHPPGQVIGAYGVGGYPHMSIDSSKTDQYPVSFYNYLTDVNFVTSAEADTNAAYQPIFRLRCRPNCVNEDFRRQTVGHVYNGSYFKTALLGFPLSFMKADQVGPAVDRLLSTMGDFPTSLSETELPDRVRLHQNYPNPFNHSTVIGFNLPKTSKVHLAVYNTLGVKVSTLIDKTLSAGWHTVTFDASGLASGLYIYGLHADQVKKTRKMILVK